MRTLFTWENCDVFDGRRAYWVEVPLDVFRKEIDSLLALVLRENRLDFTEYEKIDDIDAMQSIMPPELLRDYKLARDFSRFIFGAQVRYNVIYSDGQNELANELWSQYKEEKPTVSLADIQARLKLRTSVMRFLKAYKSAIDNESELDNRVIRSEKELKGAARAKLTNTELYIDQMVASTSILSCAKKDNNVVEAAPILSYDFGSRWPEVDL